MNVVTRFISVILLFLTFVVHSKFESTGDDDKGPGSSACLWYRNTYEDQCNIPVVPVDKIPEQCTSIFIFGLKADMAYRIALTHDEFKDRLDSLLQNNKRVFLFYHQTGYESGWAQALKYNTKDGGTNANCEMEGLKAFLEQYPGIKGLIFNFLTPSMFPADYPNPTENFKVYLEAMNTSFPDLIIGLNVRVRDLIDFQDNPTGQWFDLSVVDSLLDFYVADFLGSELCTPDLIATGAYPLSGNYTYTVEKGMSALEQAKVPKDKCYIQYSLGATTGGDGSNVCALYNPYTMVCTNPEDLSDLCADTLATLVEKGEYAANKANGFILDAIDSDDSGAICGCGDPSNPQTFPGFMALLDGFYGTNQTKPCPKFDRNGT